ncbi:myb DNA binding protein [Gigaspora margarita]|uniref:Myb DNA binding protein n=1 Tax=Gigaspora margarita TaxID=4874 RepID=A0A8H4ALF0_GIGMA|nr:myb DNA binding protein [Gigaspora margarita]
MTTEQDLSQQFIAGINKFKSQMKKKNTRNAPDHNTKIAEDEPSKVSKSEQCNTEYGSSNSDREDHRHKQDLTHLDTTRNNNNRQLRKKWSNEEIQALEDGMREFGTHWARILEKHGTSNGPLKHRSQVQLKDKARNEKQRRMKAGMDVGVFAQASG